MTRPQSAEVTRALRMVANGMTAYAAAKKTGIALSTIYRALARHKVPAPITTASHQLKAGDTILVKIRGQQFPKTPFTVAKVTKRKLGRAR